MGLIISAMIIGAAMLMNIESRFIILGYPGLAIILFLTAAVGGAFLVGSILLGDINRKKSSLTDPRRVGPGICFAFVNHLACQSVGEAAQQAPPVPVVPQILLRRWKR